MTDTLIVHGGSPLHGRIRLRGAKNFVSKAMVASLLGETPSRLRNVPQIRDVGVVTGLLQPDVLMSAEVKYRLPLFDLYVGGRGDLFTGYPGSPGWMRQDASLLGVFLGEGA